MKLTASLSLFLAMASSASAATVFNNRAAWTLAAGAGAPQETFESAPLGPVANPAAFASGLFAGLITGAKDVAVRDDINSAGMVNTTLGGSRFLGFDHGQGAYSFGLSLGGPGMTAMGFDISGFQPSFTVGGLTINLYDASLTLISSDFYPSTTDFDPQFVGVTSAVPFAGMQIVLAPIGAECDWVAIDDVTWVVPTPGAAALLGLAGLAAGRRRRA